MSGTSTLANPGPRTNLFGRDAELEQLRSALPEANLEHGRLVLVGGEAGIGKSALVEAFTAEARQRGAVVLTGACYDLASAPPYGPWLEISRDWSLGAGRPPLPAFITDPHALEELAGTDALLEEIADFLARAARYAPLVLVLEDLHWADSASLELLRFLARRLATLPVIIVATYRDVDLTPSDPLYRLLPQLVRESRAVRVMPRRLSSRDVEQLVHSRYALRADDEARLVAWLDRFAEGNPFYIEELLYTLEHDRVLRSDREAWELGDLTTVRVPALVRQVIDERLAWLGADALQLVQVAAVIGAEVPVDLWGAVTGADDEALAHAIEAAQRAWLLEEARGRDAFRFRHALIREALYNSFVLPRRRAWHRRVAEALSANPNPNADAVAHHFQQAGDPRAVLWLVKAGERATRNYAWRIAVDRLQAALDLLGQGPEEDLKRALLLYYTGMLARRSDPPDAVRRMEEALRLARSLGLPRLVGLTTADLGLVHCIVGRIADGIDELTEGVRLLDEAGVWTDPSGLAIPEPAAAFAMPSLLPDLRSRAAPLVTWLAVAGRLQEAVEVGQAFVARIPDHSRQVRYQDFYVAYIGLGNALMMLGRPEEARAALDAARAGHVDVAQMPWTYFLTEIAYVSIYRLDHANERNALNQLLQEIWERSTGATARLARGQSPAGSVRLQFLLGNWDVVDDWARSTGVRVGPGVGRLSGLRLTAAIRFHRGAFEQAWETIEEAQRTFDLQRFGNNWLVTVTGIQEIAAELALEQGDLVRAAHWIDLHWSWIEQSGTVIRRAEHAMLLARHAELRGDMAEARRQAAVALERAANPRQPLAVLRAQRLAARYAAGSGQLEEAVARLAVALDLSVACAVPFERALTQVALAECALRKRDMQQFHERVTDARSVAVHLRAEPLLAQIAALERQADAPQRTWSGTPAGLSERELDVLRLVARGMTDAEVAAALFISPRTVSGHLQSIYNKLGISSRTAATAFAYERGLV
ncbi:MAG: hypothetical protein DCC58_00075 [Chloroflexi bacterium]|nr:MAG: hypothetical protein DCC58_00075 [Chloroflexota bacterium]